MTKRMTDARFKEWGISDEAGELTWDENRPNSVAELWFALSAEREHAKELEARLKEMRKDCSFYKCCALSGEVPVEGSEPSAANGND